MFSRLIVRVTIILNYKFIDLIKPHLSSSISLQPDDFKALCI